MLELNSVHVGCDRTTVLHGVTVSVPDDGVVTVLGHNGAGKSTLLAMRAAQHYYVLEAGRVTFSGDGGTGAERTVRAALSV